MIGTLISKLGLGDGSFNLEPDSRRKHIRHAGIQAEVQVADRAYSVRDWSMGGVCFESRPEAPLSAGDRVNVTLRFRLPHETISIEKQVRVIRSQKRGVAAEFAPLSNDDRKLFTRVMDGVQAQSFLESQVA